MKRREMPVEVETEAGRPRAIRWARHRLEVERIVETWVVQGRWWACEECRVYWRVLTRHGVLDLYRRGDHWRLSRVLD